MNYKKNILKLAVPKLDFMFKLLILLGIISTSISCSSGNMITSVTIDTDCPPVMDYISSDFLPLEPLLADTFLTSNYSVQSIIVANAYGLVDDIRDLKTLKIEETLPNSNDTIRLATLEKAIEIDKTMNLATLEIQTLQTFLNCNNRKLIQAKTDLAQLNNTTRSTFSNSAIIIGVVSSVLVAAAVISDGQLNSGSFKDWVGIVGGLVAAGLAIISERVDKKIRLSHSHNAIAAIWNGTNDQGVFTDNTWYLLNQPYLIDSSDLSIRDSITKIWKSSKSLLLEEDNMKYIPVIMGNGGEYTEEMIQLRINMLEEVKHSIVEVSRLLSLLTYEKD